MTRQTAVVMGMGAVALVVASVFASSGDKDSSTPTQAAKPIDAALASKAEDSCWCKVKNRSSRAAEVRQWSGVSSVGASTARLGELVIVTGALQPAVGDNRFYGCAMYEYTDGSPVVMMATASPVPVRADTVIPYGLSHDGHKQLL